MKSSHELMSLVHNLENIFVSNSRNFTSLDRLFGEIPYK